MVFEMKEGGRLRNANLTQCQGKKFEGYDSIKSCLKEPFPCPTAIKGHKTQSPSKKKGTMIQYFGSFMKNQELSQVHSESNRHEPQSEKLF